MKILKCRKDLEVDEIVSDDDISYYTPYDTDANDLGGVVAALDGDRWIVFGPQAAKYIRFKFVLTGANSTVSAIYRQQERS